MMAYSQAQAAKASLLMNDYVEHEFNSTATIKEMEEKHDKLRDHMHTMGLCKDDAVLYLDQAFMDGEACHGLFVEGAGLGAPEIWKVV